MNAAFLENDITEIVDTIVLSILVIGVVVLH